MTERIGDWLQTYTGRAFWPLDPRVEEIAIEDIAHSLSNLCRFTGHTRDFYSVAQHSLIASYECPDFPLTALLHDASEAYLIDVPRPIKPFLTEYRGIEDRLSTVIAECFGTLFPLPEKVEIADRRMLATEKRDLFDREAAPWGAMLEPYPCAIVPLPPYQAKEAFLRRFEELSA
jgi:5'-deoxynucleotidase YfbR-like HD superfamily hydrolase